MIWDLLSKKQTNTTMDSTMWFLLGIGVGFLIGGGIAIIVITNKQNRDEELEALEREARDIERGFKK